jgi:hypothetical protein
MVDTLVSLVQLYYPVPYLHTLTKVAQLVSDVSNLYCVCLAHRTRTFVYLNTSAHTHWSVYKDHCVLLFKIAEHLLFMYNSVDVFSDE